VFPYLGFTSNSSCASFGSRVSRATSISWPEATEPLWRTTSRVFTLRLRALASLCSGAPSHRPPKAQDYAIMADYNRNLRSAKRVSGVGLHGSNPEPLMSALGQKETLDRRLLMSALPPKRTWGGIIRLPHSRLDGAVSRRQRRSKQPRRRAQTRGPLLSREARL
jgi:hypothetical protein